MTAYMFRTDSIMKKCNCWRMGDTLEGAETDCIRQHAHVEVRQWCLTQVKGKPFSKEEEVREAISWAKILEEYLISGHGNADLSANPSQITETLKGQTGPEGFNILSENRADEVRNFSSYKTPKSSS